MATTEAHNPNYQCHGKRCHANKRAAKAAIRNREAVFGARLVAYRCPHCGAWHTGHKIPRQYRSTPTENVIGPSAVTSCPGPDQSRRE